MSKNKLDELKALNALRRAEMIDFCIAVANSFISNVTCSSCRAKNEIKDYWYMGWFKDICSSCGEELDFKSQLNIKDDSEFLKWATKRTYEDDYNERNRIKSPAQVELDSLVEGIRRLQQLSKKFHNEVKLDPLPNKTVKKNKTKLIRRSQSTSAREIEFKPDFEADWLADSPMKNEENKNE